MLVTDRLHCCCCCCCCWGCLFLILSEVFLVSATCAPPPIPINIGNVTLSNGETARGLNLSVGSPRQSFAFLPQWPLNNSFVYGSNGFCDSSMSGSACTTFRGGQYNQFASTSQRVAATNSYPVEASPYPDFNFITEDLTLSSNITIPDFPMGVAQSDWGEQGYYPQVALGLGFNSTILHALKDSGRIASRSWSMFWGRTGATADTQLNGNFVLGGYDRAKVSGPNHTRPLTHSGSVCPTAMLITITDIKLNLANGTDVSLFGGAASTAMSACIVPDYPVLMTIPFDPYFLSFETLTNAELFKRSFGIYYYGMIYSIDPESESNMESDIFTGDLTIQLDSGLSIRIPNDQLVVPNLTIDRHTGAMVANSSEPELVLNSIQQANANDLPQIGRQFLTSAYLMSNQDTDEFTLWAANPTSDENLVAVDSQNQVVEDFCSATTSSVQSSTPSAQSMAMHTATNTPTNTPTGIPDTSSRLSTGAIAGTVIGSVAVAAGLAGLLLWFIAKRTRATTGLIMHDSCSQMTQELQDQPKASPAYVPQELYAQSSNQDAWKPHELP